MHRPGSGAAGPAAAILSAVFFGASTVAAKALLESVSPFMLAGLLYLGAGAGLGVLQVPASVRKRGGNPGRLGRGDLPWLAGAVLAGGVAAPLLMMWGLSVNPASSSALLLNLEGVFTAVLAWAFFRENIGPRAFAGMAAVLAGAAALSVSPGASGRGDAAGMAAVAAACLLWALDNNLTRRVSAGSPVFISSIKGLTAGSVNMAVALSTGNTLPPPETALLAMLTGFLGYGASLALFILALRGMGAARTGSVFSVAPFVGSLLSLLLLGEHAGPALAVAGIAMAAGVWLQLGERHEHRHTHDVIAHDHPHRHDEHHRHSHGSGEADGGTHTHPHTHEHVTHSHPHYPDIHHAHRHGV